MNAAKRCISFFCGAGVGAIADFLPTLVGCAAYPWPGIASLRPELSFAHAHMSGRQPYHTATLFL